MVTSTSGVILPFISGVVMLLCYVIPKSDER